MKYSILLSLVFVFLSADAKSAKLRFSDCPHYQLADRNLKIIGSALSKTCKVDNSITYPGNDYAYYSALCGSMKVVAGCIRSHNGLKQTDGISIHNSKADQSESPFDPALAKLLIDKLKDSFEEEFKVTCTAANGSEDDGETVRYVCTSKVQNGERYALDVPSLSNFGPQKTETQVNIHWQVVRNE